MYSGKLRLSDTDFGKIYVLLITAALAAAVWTGTRLPCVEGMTVMLGAPDISGNPAEEVSLMCMPDIIAAVLLSLPCGRAFSSFAAGAVFFLRGLSVGHTAMYCTVNSVNGAAVGALTAYSAVTLLLFVYTAIMKSKGKNSGALPKLLSYFAVSGAAVLLRAVPYLCM